MHNLDVVDHNVALLGGDGNRSVWSLLRVHSDVASEMGATNSRRASSHNPVRDDDPIEAIAPRQTLRIHKSNLP